MRRSSAWIDLVLETADVIFTPSRATAEALITYQGFDCGRIVTLDFGVSQIGDNTPPRPLKVKGPYILYVSSVHPRKNHRVAIKAWSLAFKGNEEAAPSLVCVGHSKRRKRMMLRAIVRRTPLARKLHFLAKVDDLALRTLYKNCQMFLFPSRYEGWGLPVAEALSFGKFGIVSKTTSLPEVGQHFVDYAPPHMTSEWAAKIKSYASDPGLLRAKEREIDRNYRPRYLDRYGPADHGGPSTCGRGGQDRSGRQTSHPVPRDPGAGGHRQAARLSDDIVMLVAPSLPSH